MTTQKPQNVGSDLIRIHTAITRGINIATQSCDIKDHADEWRIGLRMYIRSLSILLSGHHLGEDLIAFPFWLTKDPSAPINQLTFDHKNISHLLDGIDKWNALEKTAWEIDMLTLLKANLIELDGLWRNHIALEEKTMSPEKTANLLTQEESLHLAQELAEFGQQHSQPAEQLLPFVLYNLEPHHRAQMEHTLPANIVQELIPIVWKSAWSPMLPFLLK